MCLCGRVGTIGTINSRYLGAGGEEMAGITLEVCKVDRHTYIRGKALVSVSMQ